MTATADLLHTTDAVGLAAHVKSKDVSAAELLEAAIARAEATSPRFNFIAQHCEDRARARAGASLPDSPLSGVPFLVKDLGVDIAGVVTGSGSRALAQMPDQQSRFVDVADAAGLMIFAKTTTPELGLTVTTESRAHGQTRNPWNPDHSTGGSSGGAACAVALGVVPLAQASDGGGSVRVPASCCGLFGLKTSRGRVPLGPGRVEDWNGLSGIGPISRTVRDAAAFLDVFGHPAPGDRVRPGRPLSYLAALGERPRLRIAVMPAPLTGEAVHPEILTLLDTTVGLLAHLGHQVREAAPVIDMGALSDANVTNIAIATTRAIARQAARTGRQIDLDRIEPITAMWRHIAQSRTGQDLQESLDTFAAAGVAIDAFFGDVDILLSPTLAQPPVPLGLLALDTADAGVFGRAFQDFCPYASLANITGCPAMSLPLGQSSSGLPLGIMAMGRFGDELALLRLAAELEVAAPWAHRRPAA